MAWGEQCSLGTRQYGLGTRDYGPGAKLTLSHAWQLLAWIYVCRCIRWLSFFITFQQGLPVLMVKYVWLTGQAPQWEEWRSVSTNSTGLSVMTCGTTGMPWWCVGSWGLALRVSCDLVADSQDAVSPMQRRFPCMSWAPLMRDDDDIIRYGSCVT